MINWVRSGKRLDASRVRFPAQKQTEKLSADMEVYAEQMQLCYSKDALLQWSLEHRMLQHQTHPHIASPHSPWPPLLLFPPDQMNLPPPPPPPLPPLLRPLLALHGSRSTSTLPRSNALPLLCPALDAIYLLYSTVLYYTSTYLQARLSTAVCCVA